MQGPWARAATAGAAVALAALTACAAPAPRLAPPADLACARDRLTAYAGVVHAVDHSEKATRLTIATDWDTTETVEVRHDGRDDAARHFLLAGRPFTAADWPRIESTPGRIANGLRVIAWVCEDGRTPPVIDWRPGERARTTVG